MLWSQESAQNLTDSLWVGVQEPFGYLGVFVCLQSSSWPSSSRRLKARLWSRLSNRSNRAFHYFPPLCQCRGCTWSSNIPLKPSNRLFMSIKPGLLDALGFSIERVSSQVSFCYSWPWKYGHCEQGLVSYCSEVLIVGLRLTRKLSQDFQCRFKTIDNNVKFFFSADLSE